MENEKCELPVLSEEVKLKLKKIANQVFLNNKGLLATDESESTLGKKLLQLGIKNDINNRTNFRKCFYDVQGIEKYISGIILNEEAFDQLDTKDTSFPDMIESKGILVGLKVDKGLMSFEKNEFFSVGIDDLNNRLKENKYKNVSFVKWRSLFKVIPGSLPTDECIEKNCLNLCRYAVISQNNGIVPIIEPEISYEGNYSIQEMQMVAKKIYSTLFKYLNTFNAYIPGIILKVSFITSSNDCKNQVSLDEIGKLNIEILMDTIPPAVAGIVYLSGGHSSQDSFKILSAIQKYKSIHSLSFSFARALTNDSLEIWKGKEENLDIARKVFIQRLEECLKANKGKF